MRSSGPGVNEGDLEKYTSVLGKINSHEDEAKRHNCT